MITLSRYQDKKLPATTNRKLKKVTVKCFSPLTTIEANDVL